MNTGPEEFEKLRKLLKLKRYEQPPPGYFNHFSSLIINRIEKEGEPQEISVDAPWLRKIFGMFESSPVFSGLFGAAVCGLVIFGIAAANHPTKLQATTISEVTTASVDTSANDVAFNGSSHAAVSGRSTDPIFASNALGTPFGSGITASVQPVAFSTGPQ
jgi:hypothetical protein